MGTMHTEGSTDSTTGISTPGTFQETYFSGATDMYLMAINSTGTAKVWGTYWGGSASEFVRDIEIDPAGNLIVAGNAQSGSTGLASAGSFQPEPGGSHEVIIGKFTTSGQRVWATYFGGARSDGLDYNGLDLDEDGNILLLSDARPFSTIAPSSNLGTPCSYQTTWDPGGAGSSNGEWIITKLSND